MGIETNREIAGTEAGLSVPSRVGGNGLAPWGFPVQLRPDPALWEPPTTCISRRLDA